MRTAALTLLSFVAFGFAAKAQKFSLLPQVGFENSKTKISYNNLSSFSPAGIVFSPQAGLQFAYRSKAGHGFYLGASSSRSSVLYSFSNPETGMNDYRTTTGNMQLRWEGGYQFSSKPVYFNKPGSKTTKPAATSVTGKKNCSYAYKSNCSKTKTASSPKAGADKSKQQLQKGNRGSWVRLQPSAGIGFIPNPEADVITKIQNGQTTYQYPAGNWNTALMTGIAFEFGKNKTRMLTVGVNYMKGIGNMNTQTITTVAGAKTITTQIKSEVSGWNMRVGIPFTLSGKKPAIKQQGENKINKPKSGCQQYRIMYRCHKTI
jgi:hypothetical protein